MGCRIGVSGFLFLFLIFGREVFVVGVRVAFGRFL